MSTEWAVALRHIKPYVFKITTPSGSGTGFQISYSAKKSLCGIATALHVVDHSHEWEEPIKITHHESGKSVTLRHDARAVFTYPDKDLAFILFSKGDIPAQTSLLSLMAEKKNLRQGVQMAWCGFPAVASSHLCFFTGHVSAYLSDSKSYLADGVAINGVSGGPAFALRKADKPYLIGVVSAYIPNRATGEALPGVCVIRSVTPYQPMLKAISSLDEAKKGEEPKMDESDSQSTKKVAKKTPKKKVAKKKATKKKVAKKP